MAPISLVIVISLYAVLGIVYLVSWIFSIKLFLPYEPMAAHLLL
jgi:hypothetical protein